MTDSTRPDERPRDSVEDLQTAALLAVLKAHEPLVNARGAMWCTCGDFVDGEYPEHLHKVLTDSPELNAKVTLSF